MQPSKTPKRQKSNLPGRKKKSKSHDPFKVLKYIAYLRTGFPASNEDLDEETLINYAKWQICSARSILWLDPIWDAYTPQEILIEFFAIKFDESAELRQEFERDIVEVKAVDLSWFDEMEAKYRKAKPAPTPEDDIIKSEDSEEKEPVEQEPDYGPEVPPVEFEDNY